MRKSVNGRAQIHALAYLTLGQVTKGALKPFVTLPNITTASITKAPCKPISLISPTCLLKALLLPLTQLSLLNHVFNLLLRLGISFRDEDLHL